ncbi:MAG: hypothetical protein GY910_20485 [bacterium]|nr:hypothetical protein [bacterium]
MSFNPLMTLLVRSTLDSLEEKPSVIELGNQTLRADDRTLRSIIERSPDKIGIDIGGLERLASLANDDRADRAADYYRLLGFSDYTAIDVNDKFGSLVMDLNKNLVDEYSFRETYSLVTNNGTGEHIFNQDAVFRNVHQLTRVGGLMLHVIPFHEFINHGFFTIQPNLYPALAQANDYELLSIGIATRSGRGVVFKGEGLDAKKPILLEETIVPLRLILSRAKVRRAGAKGLIKRFAGKNESRRFAGLLRRMQRDTPNLLCFTLLRKRSDTLFQTPIQGIYESDVHDDGLRAEYGIGSTPNPRT